MFVFGAILHHYGLLDVGRRFLFALYPLFQAATAGLMLRYADLPKPTRLMIVILYGTFLLVVLNPELTGWPLHLAFMQTYYSVAAYRIHAIPQ
jgi:hypothetical protein